MSLMRTYLASSLLSGNIQQILCYKLQYIKDINASNRSTIIWYAETSSTIELESTCTSCKIIYPILLFQTVFFICWVWLYNLVSRSQLSEWDSYTVNKERTVPFISMVQFSVTCKHNEEWSYMLAKKCFSFVSFYSSSLVPHWLWNWSFLPWSVTTANLNSYIAMILLLLLYSQYYTKE